MLAMLQAKRRVNHVFDVFDISFQFVESRPNRIKMNQVTGRPRISPRLFQGRLDPETAGNSAAIPGRLQGVPTTATGRFPAHVAWSQLKSQPFDDGVTVTLGGCAGLDHIIFESIVVSIDWFKGIITGESHDLHGKIYGFRLRFSHISRKKSTH